MKLFKTVVYWIHTLFFARIEKKILNVDSKVNKLDRKIDTASYLLEELFFQKNKHIIEKSEKIKIVFLYVIDSIWPSWNSFYNTCINDTRFEVTLVFLDMSTFPNQTSQQRTALQFLERNQIKYTHYADYDPQIRQPDIVVYQTPHQWYYKNFPQFSITNIKRQGIRTVYISYGIEYDTTVHTDYLHKTQFKNFIQINAWRVFVMHDDIKKDYYIHCPAGGNHVMVFGHPKFDNYVDFKESLPFEITDKAAGRKIITYQIHLYNANDCKKTGRTHTLSFEQTSKNIEYLKDRKDIYIIITIHPLYETYMLRTKTATLEQLQELKNSIIQNDNTFLYEGPHQVLIARSDAFITENSSLMIEMAYFNKPVLYLYDFPVAMRDFSNKIIQTFHHGKTEEDIKQFIDNAVLTCDPLVELRKDIHSTIFKEYDGKIGQRIKNYIYDSIQKENSHP